MTEEEKKNMYTVKPIWADGNTDFSIGTKVDEFPPATKGSDTEEESSEFKYSQIHDHEFIKTIYRMREEKEAKKRDPKEKKLAPEPFPILPEEETYIHGTRRVVRDWRKDSKFDSDPPAPVFPGD